MSSITVVKKGSEQTEHVRTEDSLSLLVHIRSYTDGVPAGTFLTLPSRERYEFCGLDQMLLLMEDLMDSACGTEAASGHRYLCQKPYLFRREAHPPAETASGGAACLSGEKVTFTVQVCYRRNRSMQGRLTVQMDQKQESISFR
ncbi:MAG: hypothetical protein K2N46_03220, partial [Lachnospiraceae bacterium]|nr:hypothetical protein [Lachnospiraceae bacterium]